MSSSSQNNLNHYGELVSGLMHELKNPLSTLSLNLQLLSEDLQRPQTETERRTARKVDILQQETRRLEEILNKFTRVAGRINLHPVRVDAAKLVEELLAFYEPQADQHRITLRWNLHNHLPWLQADPDLLKQALLNLILNAESAMPEGGELMIRLENAGNGVQLDVIDTGHGIAAENLPKIFQAYFSTKRGGTGLGLAITRRIIEAHGGNISVSSESGRGTQFSIWLPAAEAKEDRNEQAQ